VIDDPGDLVQDFNNSDPDNEHYRNENAEAGDESTDFFMFIESFLNRPANVSENEAKYDSVRQRHHN
jgi:hypothetical protein